MNATHECGGHQTAQSRRKTPMWSAQLTGQVHGGRGRHNPAGKVAGEGRRVWDKAWAGATLLNWGCDRTRPGGRTSGCGRAIGRASDLKQESIDPKDDKNTPGPGAYTPRNNLANSAKGVSIRFPLKMPDHSNPTGPGQYDNHDPLGKNATITLKPKLSKGALFDQGTSVAAPGPGAYDVSGYLGCGTTSPKVLISSPRR